MAYYDALIAHWPSVAGANTAAKLAAINAETVAAAQPAILPVNKIINAIVAADFTNLTSTQLQQMALLLGGNTSVDASPGTTIRAVFQSIFAGKTTTLTNLGALVAPFDNATVLWWKANSYLKPFELADLTAAGLS